MSIIQPNRAHVHIYAKFDQFHHRIADRCSHFGKARSLEYLPEQDAESIPSQLESVESCETTEVVETSEISSDTTEVGKTSSNISNVTEVEQNHAPNFINDHFTNLNIQHQIGEITMSSLLMKSPWSKKPLIHSPFPTVVKTMAMHWVNHKNMIFLGWPKNGELTKDFKVYTIHQSRNKIGKDSISYRVDEILKPFNKKSRKMITGFYLDVENFHTGVPSYDNYFYIFDEFSMKWETNFKVQGVKPPSTIGSSSVNFQLEGRDMLYVFGGETKHGGTNDLWCYDMSLRKEKIFNRWRCINTTDALKPPKLHNQCMIREGDYLIMYGGQYANSCKLSNQIWGFNLITEHWFLMECPNGELPALRDCKMTTGYKNSLFIYGGYDIKGEINETLYVYNTISQHAYYLPTTLRDHPGQRVGFEMCFDYELKKLIIIGGEEAEHTNDLIHDCNEVIYNHVYELDWKMLTDFVIRL